MSDHTTDNPHDIETMSNLDAQRMLERNDPEELAYLSRLAMADRILKTVNRDAEFDFDAVFAAMLDKLANLETFFKDVGAHNALVNIRRMKSQLFRLATEVKEHGATTASSELAQVQVLPGDGEAGP